MTFENQRVSQLKSAPTMAVALRAKQLAAEGRTIIDLSLGEPDLDTPPHIIDAAVNCLRRSTARHTQPGGLLALRQAIVDKFARENDLHCSVDEIAIANGAKQILHNALMATLERSDEVIVPAPHWGSYTDMVRLHGGIGVVLPCNRAAHFKLSAAELEAAITPATRWLMLNSPNNPTGAIYSRAEFEALGAVLERHPRILIISDEVYEHVLLGDMPFTPFLTANPQLKDRTLVVNGVSKAYAMTGWRLGYGAGPKALIAAISKLQSQSVGGVSAFVQEAAAAALNGPQDFVREAAREFRERAELFVAGLNKIDGLRIEMPDGAFYAYPECAGLIGKRAPNGKLIDSDVALATYLLEEGGVSSVPGAAFGLSPYLRFSVAANREVLNEALVKLEASIAALR